MVLWYCVTGRYGAMVLCRVVPFIWRVALPKKVALRAACGVPEQNEGAKLSAIGAGVGVAGLSASTGGVFENAMRVGFRLSGVYI